MRGTPRAIAGFEDAERWAKGWCQLLGAEKNPGQQHARKSGSQSYKPREPTSARRLRSWEVSSSLETEESSALPASWSWPCEHQAEEPANPSRLRPTELRINDLGAVFSPSICGNLLHHQQETNPVRIFPHGTELWDTRNASNLSEEKDCESGIHTQSFKWGNVSIKYVYSWKFTFHISHLRNYLQFYSRRTKE